MARYVDPECPGPVIELGPGTGPVTEALVEHGVAEERLVLVEFNPTFCQLLRAALSARHGDAGRRLCDRGTLGVIDGSPPPRSSRACRCSPSRCRCASGCCAMRFALMRPDAPFVQFTYAVVPPIPKSVAGVQRRSVRAHLDESAAGARLGLPQGADATSSCACGAVEFAMACSARASHVANMPSQNSGVRGLDPHRFLQRAPRRACRQGTDAGRRRRHPISLADYPLPLYDGNLEAPTGRPTMRSSSSACSARTQGIFIASPEYNASVTPLLKNTVDWVSRVREGREPPLAAYKNRVFALAAPRRNGPYRRRCAR